MCVSQQQVKLTSPDYTDCDKEEALVDFLKRIECYQQTYIPLDDDTDRYWYSSEAHVFLSNALNLTMSMINLVQPLFKEAIWF